MDDDSGTITGGDISAAMDAARGDSPSSTPTPESTPAASASAETTTPPAGSVPADGSQPSTDAKPAGVPPEHRWPSILENARNEWKQQHGWAEQVSQQEFRQVTELARRASADPIGYLQDFIKELQASPEHAAQLRSLAAKALAQRAQQTVAEQEPQPDLPIALEDGRVVHLYSADQQAKREAFLQQKWMQSVEQKLQPFQQTHQALQAEREAAQATIANERFASTVTSDVKSWEGVTDETMKAMAVQVANDPQLPKTPSFEQLELAVNRAYRKVVLPGLRRSATASVLSNHQLKVNANTVSPGQSSAGTPKPYTEMSWGEAFRHELAARGK